KDHYFGTKRPCLDTGYFETYNLPHVRLVDLRRDPIRTVTETGVDTATESFEFDAIVFATGFDAMTGAIVSVDITGRDGATLKDEWAHGPINYLGLTVVGFPNFFSITGPGSPSVLSNMAVSIEQHVDWVADCIADLRRDGFEVIEPTPVAQAGWVRHVNDCADITLYPKANSWYMGANVPGKPRVFLPYIGGVDRYRKACDEVTEQDYLGFVRSSADRREVHDGEIRRLQPDVQMVLEAMAMLNLPTMESMTPEQARQFSEMSAGARPPGPDVAEIVDGTLPGAGGDLEYRLFRPPGEGPFPIVVWFHGGGWVIGSHVSDEPMCRDLCVRTGAIVISINYRHGPEARFPSAHDDAFAAVQWVADNATSLGGVPGRLAVCGWSAGGNLATVACRMARDAGGPAICGQVLVTPVADGTLDTESYRENAEGYMLTAALMHWFFDNYVDPADRLDPRVAPLRADLSGMPPAMVVTAEFDPLCDEGDAYAHALAAAGVPVEHIQARGHIHTSIGMVDVTLSSAPIREKIATALRDMLGG
ncbi:MAG TPA: alpha/beta hydrolase, partial [Ilumatobacteraceae bacterium]|nr:alpha/beta hydrolase [Ilumatobacteraceae bacterium]